MTLLHSRPIVDARRRRVVGHELHLPPVQTVKPGERDALMRGAATLQIECARTAQQVMAVFQHIPVTEDQFLLLPIVANAPLSRLNGLAGLLESTLACALPLERLVLQLEETAVDEDPQQARRLVSNFREHGYRVSISGFGAGFEGLKELLRSPPDFLRLTPSLTNEVVRDRSRKSIVTALAQVAIDLNIQLIADSVGKEDQSQALTKLGVELQQGPLHGGPLAIDRECSEDDGCGPPDGLGAVLRARTPRQ